MANRNVRKIGRFILAFILNFVLIFGVVFNLAACAPQNSGGEGNKIIDDSTTAALAQKYAGITAVGYYGKITNSNVPRQKPKMGSENPIFNSSNYPVYGQTYGGDKETAITESSLLTATGTANAGGGGYTWMDKDGKLYAGTRADPQATGRKLYKHYAAVDNYHGNVSDSQHAVEKVLTMRPRGYNSYNVTGLYAPAGEVITVKISEADMNATGGLTIHIGQALYNGQANNIWAAKAIVRMPHLLNTMVVNKDTAKYDAATHTYTAYVGSFIGGPIYIRNNNATFTATISGGVEYLHFVLGYTTVEEFTRIKSTSTAPFFDLEVWDHGVLISGPRVNAERFSYEELYQAAILWDKITTVTTTGNQQGIVMLFDAFVAAGAAVAFPGRSSVNCPEGWMANALNYNLMVTSGAWGNFHEYHHNFQNFGVGGGGEVTNNALTLVSYALFTKISLSRTITNYGGDGVGGGWNRYTSATWALEQTLKIARSGESPENGNQGLALYATLLHNFGPDNFIRTKAIRNTGNYQQYMNVWEEVTHNNMYYYFKNILGGDVTQNADASSYPMFVPVSSVYQTGRSYIDGNSKEKKDITTMQPYQIKDGEPFTVDLSKYTTDASGSHVSGSIIIPDGFTYTVKNVTQPARGTLTKVNDYTYTYTPAAGQSATSGEIRVTLELNGPYKVDDVDLLLEFQPTKELNKMVLERTIYTYADGEGYTEATDAFDHDFVGYEDARTVDHTSPGQNANTDIWFRGADTEANRAQYPNDPDHYFTNNQVHVIDGKMYFDSDGKYRVYLRARWHAALYFSLDGTSYELGGKIDSSQTMPGNGLQFRGNDPNTYFDIEFNQGTVKVYLNVDGGRTLTYDIGAGSANWLYIKEVLVVKKANAPNFDYIGVGMKKWDKFQYTIEKVHYNASGKQVADEEADGYEYTISTYKNGGNVVAREEVHITNVSRNKFEILQSGALTVVTEAAFKEFVETPVIMGQPYANAYRRSYEFPDNSNFEADYFYKREYTYNYTDNVQLGVGQQSVVVDQCKNNKLGTNYGGDDYSVLVDGIKDQGGKLQLHTNDNGRPSEEQPFTIVIDLGDVYTANRFVLYTQPGRSDPQYPTKINLYASLDGVDYELIGNFTDLTMSNGVQTIDFDDTVMRYYKMEITETVRNFVIIRELEMWHMFGINGGKQITPDDASMHFDGDWRVEKAQSTYGHTYVGQKGMTLEFDFTGTRLGILSSSLFDKNFEVYIDGSKIDSIALKEDNGFTVLTYLSDALGNGNHHVEIKCTGEANINSIVVYP